jgi:hypothetical protein
VAHGRFEFEMPAGDTVVFDAFHYHRWRLRWDSLVSGVQVDDGAACPSVGAITENTGRGLLRALSMQTRFVSYGRPRLAAASMVGRHFPFTRWAASMHHRPAAQGRSTLVYTYTFEVAPRLRWCLEPVVQWFFDRETRKRFARLQRYLTIHASEVADWQRAELNRSSDGSTRR